MLGLLVSRSLRAIVATFVVSFVVFALLYEVGDPVTVLLHEASMEEQDRVREVMGFNRPLLVQYGEWIWNALHGDFGESYHYRSAVMPILIERFPVTVTLAFLSLSLALLISFPSGIYTALKHNSIQDQALTVLVLIGQSMPPFWVGIMLMLVFSVTLGLLPASGWGDWKNFILPVLTLGLYITPIFMRLIRSSMLEVLNQDFIRTARSKGLTERRVILVHALKNAAIPIVTLFWLTIGLLMSGSIITETVFAVPGLGLLTVRAITQLDYPIVMAATFIQVQIIIIANWAADISIVFLNPRISKT